MDIFLGVMWGLSDLELFAGIADTLENVVQASVSSVVENVQVPEITPGSNSCRILSLRAVPDGIRQRDGGCHPEAQ